MTTDDIQKTILNEIEQSELTRNDAYPDVITGTRPNRAKSQEVYSLRLPTEIIERVETLAGDRGVPASALMRGYIIAGLEDIERGGVGASVNRLKQEIERLSGMLS